tara:strand:+ start:987 stop:1190 length:204 start_codon:yes stop_codon:yes gene_type:complete
MIYKKQKTMKPNFKDNKSGKDIYIARVRTKIIKGERKYFDDKWQPLDVTKLGKVQNIGVRTETKNRI